MAIDETGGTHGVRDHHAAGVLEALPKQRAFGQELYPTIFLKAAVYARNIIQGHPFIDGNKRAAMIATSVFLENNGYGITAKSGTIEIFALRVIGERFDLEEIAAWLERNSRLTRRD